MKIGKKQRAPARLRQPFTRAGGRLAILLGTAVLLAVLPAQAWDADYVEHMSFSQTVAIAYNGISAVVSNGAGTGVTYVQNGANLSFTSTAASPFAARRIGRKVAMAAGKP